MSARQRRARGRALRQAAALRKVSRRRARGTPGKPAAAATVAALTFAGLAPLEAAAANGPVVSAASTAEADCVTPGSNPSELAELNGMLFFAADDGVRGVELWRSDGTEKGTVLVRDIDPDLEAEYGPADMTAVGGTLFFTADDGVNGRELWKSDGSRAGTVLVEDINPSNEDYSYGGGPENLVAVGGTLFFTADDGARGTELWKSDGTRAGTVMVKDIHPESDNDYGSPDNLSAAGGTLFFTAGDGVNGRELWKSDGTRAGTVMVKDINPDPQGYYDAPSELTAVADILFFTAEDGRHGRELWRSDGTAAGTVMVEDISPDPERYSRYSDYSPTALTDVGGTLFFTADDGTHGRELWRSDGTSAGTVMIEDVHAGGYDGARGYLTDVAGAVFFTATDGTHGPELWRSDGTAAGTRMVTNIHPGVKNQGPYLLTSVGSAMFFTADDGTHGRELWTSDGTAAGTVLVEDISPDDGEDDYDYYDAPYGLTDVGGTLFFTADDGAAGRELWRSDGTAAGTVMVEDVNRGAGFRVARTSTANKRTGVVRAKARVPVAGELVVAPARGRLVKTVTENLESGGRTTVKLVPTAKGMRKLERARREARREGRKVGRLEVDVRFSFSSCAGGTSSQVHRFTLKLR